MTEAEKKLLQAQHRLEEAQARDRVKERKMRTRRLIQEGAILEKVLPEVQAIELSELEGYLSRRLGKQILLMFVKDFFLEVAQKKGRTKRTHQIAGSEKMM